MTYVPESVSLVVNEAVLLMQRGWTVLGPWGRVGAGVALVAMVYGLFRPPQGR